ncbi:MAG TPA: hypothetical protein VFV08_17000, partial [Puia sp.]|nr:hypothetical protein [Puia sp.]
MRTSFPWVLVLLMSFASCKKTIEGSTQIANQQDNNTNSLTLQCIPYNLVAGNNTNLIQNRTVLGGIGTGGRALFGLGATGTNNALLDKVNIYSSSTNSWSSKQMSELKWDMSFASGNGKIAIAGGYLPIPPNHYSNLVDLFDVANNTWSQLQLTVPRENIGSTIYTGKIWLGGGTDGVL